MKKHILRVTISEVKNGWLWKEMGRTFKTAANALRAVKRDGQSATPSDGVCIQKVTWEPATKLGALIVRGL
jgi:hypothetical protein